MAEKEWFTQQEIATELNVNLERVRAAVGALDNAGIIRTTRDPRDRRFVLVNAESMPTVRKALLGDVG